MFRWRLLGYVLVLLTITVQRSHASSFGYSININLGAEVPIEGPAGLFGDQSWNQFTDNVGDQARLEANIFNDPFRSGAVISWNSPGVRQAKGVEGGGRGDQAMMSTYLASPSEFRLEGLDQVIPGQQNLSYSLILYTFGGRPGEEGIYVVNGQEQQHVDTAIFDGDFVQGSRGNVLVFPNLTDPDLFIKTDGHAPINAMSLVYCLPGDFNEDGQVDVKDIELLSDAVKNGDKNDQQFDVNLDLQVNFDDVMSWIKCSKGTCVGDVNLDGAFTSDDLVELFTEGLYDTDNEATWTSGDWNGDCKFDNEDLVVAFIEGCYDSTAAVRAHPGPNSEWIFPQAHGAEMSQIPEPTTGTMMVLALGCLGLATRQMRTRSGSEGHRSRATR